MQIVRLEFEGIGPFTGRHEIDVRALGAGGLFLLEGPTGAGKTTILDAIVFALYGDVAGADSSKARLVSTQLPPGVEPFVDLTLETSRGLLRVRRVPEHQRRKSRGAGTTVGRAAIKLWRLASADDAEGTLLSTSLQEATEELQRAIGLTKKQFTQTVVLPQGDFATFLRAKPEERRGVLQDIFGTEFYERLARQLAELAAGFRRSDADARVAFGRAAAGFAAVGWPDADERSAFETACAEDTDAGVRLAGERVESLAVLAEASAEVAELAAQRARDADAALHQVLGRNALVAELACLRGRRAELEASAQEVESAAERLGAAERAERARPAIEGYARARVAWESSRSEVSRTVAAVAESPDADLIDEALDPVRLEADSVAAREARSALTDLVEKESGLRSRAEQLRIQLKRLGDLRSGHERERANIEIDRGRAADLGPRLEKLLATAETKAECVEAEMLARGRRQAVGRMEDTSRDLAQALRAEQDADAAAAAAQDAHREARATWLSGLAGTLAGELVRGRACPVCGSKSHPQPAALPAGAVDRATVERLEAVAQKAGEASAAALARSDSLATALREQQDAVGELTLVEAELALADAVERRRLSEKAARDAGELRRAIEALLAGAEERERRVRDAEQEEAAERGRTLERGERLERDRRLVAEGVGGYATVAERAAALARRAELAKLLAHVRRQSAEAEAAAGVREGELDEALAAGQLESVGTARAAMLSEAARAELRERVEQHRTQSATVAERLAEERFVEVLEAEPADEAPARAALDAARSSEREAQKRRGELAAMLARAGEASAELAERAEQVRRVGVEAEPYLRMAELANAGQGNLVNVTLPTFVLLRRFEEVVDLANVRLDAMTAGRYALRRTDAREGRSHKLGLGLVVVDHASGDATREPGTLSGGETFQASLALALGLADAVTAEAGGVELSTLFVDEGFGSLDPEALDMVMNQLTALRDGGRCVGVVSHVAEMKQRIAERVTVIPRRDGTSILTTTVDAQQPLAG